MILPGLMCDARMFAAQQTAFDATVIDGYYGGAATIEAMAEHALSGIPDGCALFGHSMGGRVALAMWRMAPNRIARIAIANSGVHPVRPGEAEARHALLALGRTEGMAALVDRWLPPMVGPALPFDSDGYRTLRTMAIDAGVEVYAAQIAALLARPDAISVLPTLACPVAIIGGAHDQWSPVAQQQSIAAAIPGAMIEIVADAGHMAPAEQPEAFNRAVARWLVHPNPQPSPSKG
ncbi:alpha/beta fold hydrolase [Sphingomonas sp. RS6]